MERLEHSGDQLAGAENVGSDGKWLALCLLWTGVSGRKCWRTRAGFIGNKQASGAKVHEFNDPCRINKHIAGLEIAVNDQVPMGIGDSGANLNCKRNAMPEVKLAGFAVAIKMHGRKCLIAYHLHDQVRRVLPGNAAVEEPRDMRMVQSGKCIALAEKDGPEQGRVERSIDDFNGYRLFRISTVTMASIDLAHPATAEQAIQAILVDLGADARFRAWGRGFAAHVCACVPETIGCGNSLDQGEHFLAQGRISRGVLRDDGGALGLGNLHGAMEHVFYFSKRGLRVHGNRLFRAGRGKAILAQTAGPSPQWPAKCQGLRRPRPW